MATSSTDAASSSSPPLLSTPLLDDELSLLPDLIAIVLEYLDFDDHDRILADPEIEVPSLRKIALKNKEICKQQKKLKAQWKWYRKKLHELENVQIEIQTRKAHGLTLEDFDNDASMQYQALAHINFSHRIFRTLCRFGLKPDELCYELENQEESWFYWLCSNRTTHPQIMHTWFTRMASHPTPALAVSRMKEFFSPALCESGWYESYVPFVLNSDFRFHGLHHYQLVLNGQAPSLNPKTKTAFLKFLQRLNSLEEFHSELLNVYVQETTPEDQSCSACANCYALDEIFLPLWESAEEITAENFSDKIQALMPLASETPCVLGDECSRAQAKLRAANNTAMDVDQDEEEKEEQKSHNREVASDAHERPKKKRRFSV